VDLETLKTEIIKTFAVEWGLGAIQPRELLAVWWVFAQLTDEDIVAARASLTQPADGGVDAVFVSHETRTVHLIQSKLHDSEVLDDPSAFEYLSGWGAKLAWDEPEFLAAIANLSALARGRLKAARVEIAKGYEIQFDFISTGRAASTAAQPANFRYVGGKRLATLFEDYLGGVRPIPSLSLGIAAEHAEFANPGDVNLGVYMVSGGEVNRLANQFPYRLFARNVRGFLGPNKVNEKIVETVSLRPSEFVFLNNGLTVVCDRSYVTHEQGTRTLTLENPQVVNGQQTSRSLASVAAVQAAQVQVTVKVVTIERAKVDSKEYDRLVRAIVLATNRQSSIPETELRSNDREQVELQRRLAKLGYYYARKTATHGEYRLKAGMQPLIVRREFADAVAGCLWESLPHRRTKGTLYEDEFYDAIFAPESAERGLFAWHLWRDVQARLKRSRKGAARDQGKWLVLYETWGLLTTAVDFPRSRFLAMKKGPPTRAFTKAMDDLIREIAAVVDRFYVAKRVDEQDPISFFKAADLDPGYRAFLDGPASEFKPAIDARIVQLRAVLGDHT
jgi:AIPR protein